MNISKINTVSHFNGCNSLIKCQQNPIKADYIDGLDNYNFDELAQDLDNKTDDGCTSPMKFFLVTTAIALGSFAALRGTAYRAINKLDGKFPLFNGLETLGNYVNGKFTKFKSTFVKPEKFGFKSFMKNSYSNLIDVVRNYGAKGLKEETKVAYKGDINSLYIKNAVTKAISGMLGLSAAGMTIASRTKDSNKNGIPDTAEKTFGTVKELAEVLPSIAEAASFA